MPQFKKGDRVVLTRGCKGLAAGALGTIMRDTGEVASLSGSSVASMYWKVRWDQKCVAKGRSVREHKDTTFKLVSKVMPVPQPVLKGVDKRLALLQFDDADAGLGNLMSFSDQLKDIAAASRRLRSLQNDVRHVALYRGPELNLYLTIKGKDVHLVKEVDGVLQESLSVPLPVFARMIESLKAETT